MKRIIASKVNNNNLGTVLDVLSILNDSTKLKIKAERSSDSSMYIDFGQFRGYFSVELPELNDYDDIPVDFVDNYMLDCLVKSVDYISKNYMYISLYYDDITKLGYEIYNDYHGI